LYICVYSDSLDVMKKAIVFILLVSAGLFSCQKEVITPVASSEMDVFETRGQKGGSSTFNGQDNGTGGETDGITDPNNDKDEDRKKKGK
jgi:hypothetical protein